MPKKTVLIADDHPVFRIGIRQVIDDTDEWQVVAEAINGEQAIQLYAQHQPDIIVLDISMGETNGLRSAEAILAAYPTARCVMLTMYREVAYCQEALSLGVLGYLVKDDATENMMRCFQSVLAGRPFISDSVLDDQHTERIANGLALGQPVLSQRELQVLNAIAQLKVNKVIAKELDISINTVLNHRRNICKKLNLSGRQALLQYAVGWAKINH